MNFEIQEIVVNCILFKINEKYSFPFMNKNTSIKLGFPSLTCPSANPCNPCHRSGIQHEKTTGTATAMETRRKIWLFIFVLGIIIGEREKWQVFICFPYLRKTIYGIFSNYRMFVCPSEIINIIMKYAQYYCLAVNKTLIRERHN